MRLLIDAGNTRIKWAVASSANNDILANGVVVRDWDDLSDYAGKIESAWLSCVASQSVLDGIINKIETNFGVEVHVAEVSANAAGLVNNYADLEKLGVDRWVAAMGARYLVKNGALIVIDAGTAITIDLVSAADCFEGGVILPGFASMHDVLLKRTAGIDSFRQSVDSVIGKNTRECINSGVQFGLVGAVERVVSEICETLPNSTPRVLIMGGDADVIAVNSKLKLKVELQLHMIFYGLMLLSNK